MCVLITKLAWQKMWLFVLNFDSKMFELHACKMCANELILASLKHTMVFIAGHYIPTS